MSSLNKEPEVMRMAGELGVDWRSDPAEKVVQFCVERIGGWLAEFGEGSFPTMDKVERLVCAKLKLVIEEVDCEETMELLIAKYPVQKGEAAFARLRDELDEKTFGVLMRRERPHGRTAIYSSPSLTAAATKRHEDILVAGTRLPTC